jgi:hypothetical protein
MLESVEKVNRKETFKAFQYALHTPPTGTMPLLIFSYLDEEDDDFAVTADIKSLPASEISLREEEMSRRLDGRTKGLLEVTKPHDSDLPYVDFLHRTARDFLHTRDMRSMMKRHLEKGFKPNISLCKAFLAQMKLGPFPRSDWRSISAEPLETVMFYAHKVEIQTSLPVTRILDEVERVVSSTSRALWQMTTQIDGGFLGYLVSNNLQDSVMQRLALSPRLASKLKVPLLHTALRLPSGKPQSYLNPEMISMLLSHGADPNENLSFSSTVWTEFLNTVYNHYTREDLDTIRRTLQILLEHGADPDIPVQVSKLGEKHGLDSGSYLPASEVIQIRLPKDAEWLLSKVPRRKITWVEWLRTPF